MKHIGIGTAILFAAFVLAAYLDNPRERQQSHRERVIEPVYFPTPASIRPLPQPVRADYRPAPHFDDRAMGIINYAAVPSRAASGLRASVNVTDAEQAKIYAALDLLMSYELDQASFEEEIRLALGAERGDRYIANAIKVGQKMAREIHPEVE